MVTEPVLPDKKPDAFTWLINEKERLAGLIKITRDSIEKVKSQYPYTMKSLVINDEKIKARKAELEELISRLKEVIEIYNDKMEKMLR